MRKENFVAKHMKKFIMPTAAFVNAWALILMRTKTWNLSSITY